MHLVASCTLCRMDSSLLRAKCQFPTTPPFHGLPAKCVPVLLTCRGILELGVKCSKTSGSKGSLRRRRPWPRLSRPPSKHKTLWLEGPPSTPTAMESAKRGERFLMQNFAFKYEITPRVLLYYYSNFLRRADIQCSVSPPHLETWKSDRNIQIA